MKCSAQEKARLMSSQVGVKQYCGRSSSHLFFHPPGISFNKRSLAPSKCLALWQPVTGLQELGPSAERVRMVEVKGMVTGQRGERRSNRKGLGSWRGTRNISNSHASLSRVKMPPHFRNWANFQVDFSHTQTLTGARWHSQWHSSLRRL